MKISVHIVNAFTHQHRGGNPAGVVLDADALGAEQKLAVARAVNLSETAFLSKSSVATFKAEFFTPKRQIAHCGHATVAAFSLCRSLGLLEDGFHTKESVDGLLTVMLKDGQAFLHQPPTSYFHLAPDDLRRQKVMESLHLSPDALLPGAPMTVAQAGNAFLLVPLRDESILRDLRPKQELISSLSEDLGLVGYYPFVLHSRDDAFSASARMFAPRYGIPEESATGTAAAPLACYFHDVLKMESTIYRIGQGRHMAQPSPSLLNVELDAVAGQASAARVGGAASLEKVVQIED